MKKITVYMMTFAILFLSISPVYARSTAGGDAAISLSSRLDPAEVFVLGDPANYDDSLDGFEYKDQPLVKIYHEIYWYLSDKALEDIISVADQARVIDYMIVDNEIILRKIQDSNRTTIGINSETISDNFLKDILNANSQMEILGQKCNVTNVYCFDATTSHMGAAVYYCSDQGVFVRYYENAESDGIWFSEQEYAKYAMEYYDFLISEENNYDQNGEAIGGNTNTFISFWRNVVNDRQETLRTSKIGVIVALIVLIVVAGGILMRRFYQRNREVRD